MRYLVIDCETSGLSHEKNKVLTVGMLHADITKHTVKILNTEHILVKHKNYNPNGIALKINKINLKEHHKKAIPPRKACSQIHQFIAENSLTQSPLLGHNLRFDIRFLGALQSQGKTILPLLGNRIDTMYVWRALMTQNKIPAGSKSSLKTLSKYFGVNYAGAHDALQDCKITAEVFHNLLKIT